MSEVKLIIMILVFLFIFVYLLFWVIKVLDKLIKLFDKINFKIFMWFVWMLIEWVIFLLLFVVI